MMVTMMLLAARLDPPVIFLHREVRVLARDQYADPASSSSSSRRCLLLLLRAPPPQNTWPRPWLVVVAPLVLAWVVIALGAFALPACLAWERTHRWGSDKKDVRDYTERASERPQQHYNNQPTTHNPPTSTSTTTTNNNNNNTHQ
jgi:hypothetical protein